MSVEDKEYGLPRIAQLRKANTAIRFLSIEPLLEELGKIELNGIHWVIVGGESGPGARPIEKEWVINLRNQCRESSVPFFFKQWGGVRKKRMGRKLEGRTYDEFPVRVQYPISSVEECISHARKIETLFTTNGIMPLANLTANRIPAFA